MAADPEERRRLETRARININGANINVGLGRYGGAIAQLHGALTALRSLVVLDSPEEQD